MNFANPITFKPHNNGINNIVLSPSSQNYMLL